MGDWWPTDDERRSEIGFDAADLAQSIPARLAKLAAAIPDRRALSDGGDAAYTFAELVEATNSAARHLLASGVVAGQPVAIVMPHHHLAIVAELAVLAAGAIAMPLDPAYPMATLRTYFTQAKPSAVICVPETEAVARSIDDQVDVHVWTDVPTGPPSDEVELPPVNGRSDCFAFFTSGTTGEPKAAITNHRAFLAASLEYVRTGLLSEHDRSAMVAPLAFAAGACCTFYALLAGSEVCVYDIRSHGLGAFAAWMRSSRITAWVTVQLVVRPVAGLLGEPLPDLRLIAVGAAPVQHADLPLMRQMGAGPVDIVTIYACSEMPLISWNLIRPDDDLALADATHIGKPPEGYSIDVVPLDGESLGDGIGEVVISGPIMMTGYWGDAERTAEKFTYDEAADRLTFRIGDLARRTELGGIELVGRTDSVVRIRNTSVNMGAVEAALRTLDGVDDAAVVAVPDSAGDLTLAAHVSPKEGAELDASTLRTQLADLVPPNKVPRHLTVHDTLPRNERGKVLRAQLATLAARPETDGVKPPSSDTERALVELWKRMLDLPEIGVDEDFFDLGGDSLHVMELLVHLDEQWGLWRPLSTWTGKTTIEQIAATIDSGLSSEPVGTVRLQDGDPDRPALIVAYDLHGASFRFRPLAAAVGDDQSFWGLESQLLWGDDQMPTSVEQLARIHVDHLLETVPTGPYHLLGYSSGAYLVYEMAQQLLARGKEVGFIGLLDFGPVHAGFKVGRHDGLRPPGAWPERAPYHLGAFGRARYHAAKLRSTPSGQRLRYASRVLDVAKYYDRAVATADLRRDGRIRPDLRGPYGWYRQLDIVYEYTPRPIDAAATVFVSDQSAKGNFPGAARHLDYAAATDPTRGWGQSFRKGLTTVIVSGHHNDLIEAPYVDGVAAAIRTAFDEHLARHESG